MKILVIDPFGESCLDWCLRCLDAGHTVKWFIGPEPRSAHIGRGLVERVNDFRPYILWADLVFLPDNTKYLTELEAWRKKGARIVGPNVAGAAWELDRDEGTRVLEAAGIGVPHSQEFRDYNQAIAWIKANPRRFVSKPCGVEGDKALTYCAKDAADMVFQLERWKKTNKLKAAFVLQEFVDGVEFAVGGWFGPGGFIEGWEENWETKPLMNDNKGPNTGEMGTVQRFVKRSKMANLLLKPLEDQLDRIGYIGCVDVSAIIDEKGDPYPLEFTMRPGWPAFQIQQRLHTGDPAEWMVDLLEGRDPRCFNLDDVAVGVVIGLPDFPFDKAPLDEVVGVPIYGLTPSMMDSIHPSMVKKADAPCMVGGKVVNRACWCSAGTYLMTVTGVGGTVSEARRRAYSTVNKIRIPRSPMFRTDIAMRLRKELPLLQHHGYALGLDWAAEERAAAE